MKSARRPAMEGSSDAGFKGRAWPPADSSFEFTVHPFRSGKVRGQYQ